MIKYISVNEEISNAMTKCNNIKTAERLVRFFQKQDEKYTYDTDKSKYYINSFFPTFPSKAWERMVNGISEISNYNKRVPLQADIVVTGRCHCKCWHCFRAKHNKNDLTLDKIKEVMESLNNLGTSVVGITGGEPMLREDILEIIKAIPNEMEGHLYTTGYGITEEFAKNLKNSNITRCIISLDHYDEEIVCNSRNNENAYSDATNAVKLLAKNNIYTAVTVCINENLSDPDKLEKYFDFVKDLGASEIRIVMQIPQGKLENKNVGRIYAQNIDMVKSFKRKYNKKENFPTIVNFCEIESSNYFGCNAGANYIAINNDGYVTPCVAVPLSFGSVYENKLENIYNKMGKYFLESSKVCYGISSSRIIASEKIDTSSSPLSLNTSKNIAKKCAMATGKGELFHYCKTV
ncbi:radical SAM/SPASM domain-containing protein [Clostridium isatidis]|uniref:Radical SAM core domain-containing protein n=1 Tax=Clostridium isatidis TaxID=182773 RepID=A0A343JA05_9CLOT|nr:radical SAM protein [Clostridium isatidis]ASW42363.1 hypothetical protein BEN51_02335 [Clostridium isatidis]